MNAQELVEEREQSAILKNNILNTGISNAFVDSEADSKQLRAAQAIAKDVVMVGDEPRQVVSVGDNGRPQFRHSTTGRLLQNSQGDFGYQDWLKHLAENEGVPLYANASQDVTSDANPIGLVKSKMTQAEKQEYKAKHGIPAYDDLPYS